MSPSSSTPVPPIPSPEVSGRIPRRWLPALRAAWVVCALLMLANFVASIPAYYWFMRTVCSLPSQGDCSNNDGQLSAASVHILTTLHLDLNSYAIFFVTLDVLASLLPWGIGLLIFWRKSDETMGLMVSLLMIIFAGNGSTNTLSGLWAGAHPSGLIAVLLEIISGIQWIGLGTFLLTFPTGRFAPRWSGVILLLWVFTFISPPIPVVQDIVLSAASFALLGGTLFIMIYRYVRVFDAPQRQQTKWVVFAAAAWVVTDMLGNALPMILPAQSPAQLLFPTVIILLPGIVLYLGLGFAILRYRLWDIDTIINRTLVYGSLTALLSITYVGLILGLQALTRALTGQTGDEPLVTVGSTLLIIALFTPLRRRIQTFIDRRFYRRKYDAAKILEAFAASLRTEVDMADLSEHLLSVVRETMQPTQVSLWLRPTQPDRASDEQREER